MRLARKEGLSITALFRSSKFPHIAALLAVLLFPIRVVSGQNFDRTVNGELALRAYQNSFPDKVSSVAFVDNDWTITAGGETFFWAGGRILPEAEKEKIDFYGPHAFYRYAARPPSPDTFPPQFIDALRARGSEESRSNRKDTNHKFQGIIYRGLERREIEALLVKVVFLGKTVTVHRDIAQAIKNVDAEIRRWNGSAAFISSIDTISGYNWREIAGTKRMSYHSWGIAIDIQPKRLSGKAIYWLWERERNKDWMLVPLEKRWNPPDPVIEAFEREGFIWGGKWPFYDNMHFEYRPELIEFNRPLTSADVGLKADR